MISDMNSSVDPGTLISILVVLVVFLIIYYILLIRALLEMIRLVAPGVVIVFTYISLIPFPLLLILGILNLIIWHFLRKELMAMPGPGA